jgi:dTDP-4-dehydrorhamnose 3,5-epimerase
MIPTYGEPLPGVRVIQHVKHQDHRGDFCETWKISDDGMRGTFRQLNTATSSQWVVRGMHRQDQTKLVMPVLGKIFDVALEPETGRWFAAELDRDHALFIPAQYAHGYMVLSKRSVVQYIVDAPYNKPAEENYRWDQYSIAWPTAIVPVLSDKDRAG